MAELCATVRPSVSQLLNPYVVRLNWLNNEELFNDSPGTAILGHLMTE